MPIYKFNGDVYDIPQEKQAEFESQFPDASISYTAGADQYDIPVSKREDFLKDFPDAQLFTLETQPASNTHVEDNVEMDDFPMFDDEPNAPLGEPEAERGFGAGARESWKGMKAGFQNLWGETANLFTGSSQDSINALNELNDMVRQGKDVAAETENAWTDAGRELRTGAMELLPGWMIKGWKNRVADKAEKQKVLSDIREALGEAGGDVDKARAILEQRAQEMSYGDEQMAEAAEKFADVKPTEGFGAWVGSNVVQMIPSASALIVGAVTKSPAAARAIGTIGMAGMTASTAGSSMYEAREAGASDTKTWKVGVTDGMIEYLTEKLPFDRYTSRIMGKVKGEVAQDLFSALRTNKATRTELENLLVKANERLGGKLFSAKNLKEYMADMLAEGASEFSAEALQTMTSMMYEEPENYPTINEILTNGWEGAKAGFFMGAVLGGASKTMEHTQNRKRRMDKGSVDIALVDMGEGEKDVVEVVEYDAQNNKAVILRDGSFEVVSGDAISDGYRFSYDEFESARLREMEDEAIVSGNVTDGQIQGLEDNIARDIDEIKALAPEMTESEISAVLQGEMAVDPDAPLGDAVAKYQEDVARHDELVAAKRDADAAKKEAIRTEIETAVGQRFWVQESGEDDGSGIVPVSETVEEVVYADGRVGYVVGSDESGNLTMVYTDGTKGFSSRAEITEKENSGEILSNTVMGLDDYLAVKMDIDEVTREKARMQEEHALSVDEMIATHPQGSVINVGTEEAKIEVPVIAPPTKDGVIVQMPDGTTPMLTWEDVAHAEKKEITPKTNAQLNQSIVDEYRVAYTPATPAPSQPTQQKEEQVKRTSPANPLPLKADGSVDQTALWNKDPEGWAQWNDAQRQDGGMNSLAYVQNAILREQAKIAELQAAYDAESDFDARDVIEKEIATTQARVDKLSAIRDGYLANASLVAPVVEEPAPMTEEEANAAEEQRRQPLRERAQELSKKLGVKVNIAEDISDVKEAMAREEILRAEVSGGKQTVAGWFNQTTGEVTIYLPHAKDTKDVEQTFVHEVVAHKGIRGLLGEEGFNVLCDAVWDMMTEAERAKYMAYPGVNGDKRAAADEYIAHYAETMNLEESKPVWDRIMDLIMRILNSMGVNLEMTKDQLSDIIVASYQKLVKEAEVNAESEMAPEEAQTTPIVSEEQLNAPNSGEAQQIIAADGEVLADTDGKGGMRFSIRTWEEGGRDYLAAWLANDTTLAEEEKADILARMDEFYKNALLYSDTYAPFGTWSDAGVRYDNNGNPLMSVIKANGDYAMNLDFSLVCKKRRPLNRLLRTLVNRNAFATYTLRERELAEINWILQEHGFEVACALCFVDSKRYRVTGVADAFAALYNRLVKSLAPEGVQIAHFNYNNNPNVEVVENGLDTISDDQLNWNRFDRLLREYKKGSVEYKVAQYLREHPEARKLVDATDFIEAEGFESVKENNPDLLKFYNMKKGTGGPKASFGDVQYLNDILKKEKSFDAEKAYAVGGVRLQSFSDFVPHMYFDYMQLFAELAAKKLPLHAYTKEVLFAKIFGLTGAKINLSLVPAVVEGGIAPGLDAEGNYAWADPVTDAEGNVIQQGQSFPYDEAMAIQQAEGYSKNCGVIAVGISDAHIEKMLDDPSIPFIIPYHKSSLNAIVARMTNIDQYKDYTNVQNTRKASGSKLDKGTKDFNFNEYLHGLGESGTPQQAAQAYLDWCRENKFIPKFSQFAYHPNYYKLLQDFNTIDLTTGEYAPQGAVTMTFPTEQSAFGNVETLIQQGLQEDAELEEKMEQEIDGIADQILARLEEISKEPKMSEKQQAKKMAELADERMAKIKAKAQGPIDLIEEAKKAVAREDAKKGKDEVRFSIADTLVHNVEIKDNPESPLPTTKNDTLAIIPEGGLVATTSEGEDVKVSRRSVRHSLARNNKDLYAVFARIEDVISSAIRIGNIPVSEDEIGKTNSVGVYYVPVLVNGTQYSARLIVKETMHNEKVLDTLSLYNVSLHKEKTPSNTNVGESKDSGVYSGGVKSEFKVRELIHNTQENDKKLVGMEGEETRFRITPEQDKAYMEAVEAGDMETAQRMVNEAARLAMKRMLRYAAENGYDVIAWTKGEQQAERYNLAKAVQGIEAWDRKPSSKIVRIKPQMGMDILLEVDSEGKIIDAPEYTDYKGKQLSELVGKDLALAIMQPGDVNIEEDGIHIGGEGMKGFYDKMLPAFMNKYGKKWGVKVEDIDLPNLENGLTMHSVPVTEEMKASVMEGQVMFRTRMPEESSKTFMRSAVDEFSNSYNTIPIAVVYPNSRKMVAEALGFETNDLPEEVFQRVKDEANRAGAFFANFKVEFPDGRVEERNRILIFVNEKYTRSTDVDRVLFHENIHAMVLDNPELLRLGNWLIANSNDGVRARIAGPIKEKYGEDRWDEEMLCDYVGVMLSVGRGQDVIDIVPNEHKPLLNYIYERFGYKPEDDDPRRRSERRSESGRLGMDGRTDSGIHMRDTGLPEGTAGRKDGSEESRNGLAGGRASEQRSGERMERSSVHLTAEERRVINEYFPGAFPDPIDQARLDVDQNPTDAQKEAGNYKKGHLRLDGYNITIENPKGSVRRGTDSKGNAWENTLNNDYGYIRGTEGVDGDHIDVYLSDNPTEGNVFVIDQVNPETREFDEHKVMYGFDSAEEAREAYLANFSEGWNGLGTITEVSKDEFKKWIESSHRKTKPFSEYKSVRANEMQATDESNLRYRVVTNQETLDRLNSEPTIKVYRAMQLIDGKLYPPMSAKVDGELRQPIELGQWEEAEERPDLVDEKGRFKLDKGNKTSLKARYNPYFHTSPTPLNDQFSSAQTRPELVTVEVEVPESELTSGYKAEKAKDSVGKLEWKAGVVQSKLSGTRTVILSRWDKPVRIVPDSEVADVIVDMFEGKDITMPSNVVTPSLRAELERRGVPFVETDNQGNPVEEVSFRVTGTPTDEVVANGLQLTPAQTAEVAANIFAALPEESRKKLTEGLNGNILGLKDAILQIPTSLASKKNWNEEDKQMADVVAEEMTKMAGEMTRPFSASEGLWLLYNNLNNGTDLISQASRALVQRNLGFDKETLAEQEAAKDGVRYRIVGDARANTQARLYNKGAANVWTRLKESFVDMQASVEELVSAIEKATGKAAKGFENILLALNQQSSKGLAAMESYEQRFLMPMFDEIRAIMDKAYMDYDSIVRYVILKHGLERNKKLAQRDAKAHYQEIYDEMIAKVNSMDDRQKRTYLTNAQLQDADAKAKLATLQAADTSAFTDEQKTKHKRELAKAKEEAKKAKENLERAQKINSMSEQELKDELDKVFKNIEDGKDSVFKELRKNDYSGISSMFYDQLGVDRKDFSTEEEYQSALMRAKEDKYSTLEDIEEAAEREVSVFERRTDTKGLWNRINAATKETLRQQYEANMISKDQYESLRNMFEYYVPLRGFKDNTAEDMYTYYRKPNSTGYTKPILGAEGRKTEAESPFGWIAAMAGSAIASNVKNEAKLALYYFVSNRPENGIATISRTWFVHTPGDVDANGKKIYRPAYPPFSEDLSSDAAKQAYEGWQEQMRELKKQGLAYEAGQRLNLGNAVVNISDANKPEHVVTVKVAGKDYTIVINGNPRAAQAINGELNLEGTADDYSAIFGPVLRWMSSVNTSYNPEFWITNLMRDMAFTWMAVNTKEDPAYRRKFSKNYRKAFKVISLVAKNEKGTIGNSYIEDMYKDFVKYGGVTGYTQIKDSETWEKEIDNYLSSTDPESLKNGKMMRGMKKFFHVLHRFGESLEQVSRFAAFLTSREMGKSINEAIADAKEITVNFNRKGSGKMISLEESKYLTDKNGRPLSLPARWAAVGLSSIAPLGRRTIMFFNAAVQGLNSVYRLWKKNPKRLAGWTAAYFAIGVMNAALHALLDDDDDYLDIPQYERRNSLMIGGNGAYLKWALPQEARAFYALGDLAVESIMGRNPHQNVVGEALKIATEVLPVNPTEGWKAFVPSVAIPAVELMLNEDYKGAPIYNEQKWLSEEEKKRTAKWSSAYQGTGSMYKEIAQGLNYITGGDKHKAGYINLQPEKMEHIVQSAFGGTIRTADKFINTITAMIDPEEPWTVRQTPFLNRILTLNDERFKNVHVNDVFNYYKADAEHASTLEKKYIKDRNMDALNELRNSDEYRWAKIYSKYKKPLKSIQEKLKVADGTAEKKELMRQQDEIKRRMIKEISEL